MHTKNHQKKQINILLIGVFDLYHRGHVELINKSSKYGDNLFVVINGDKFTEKYKRKPIFSEQDRLNIILSNKHVTNAEIDNTGDAKIYIEKYQINKIVHGNDWPHESYLKQIMVTEEYIKERGVEFIYTDYYQGASTSQIISKIKNEN